MSRRTRAALLPLLAAAALVLAGCATPAPDPGPGSDPTTPVDVVGQGTVLQVGDAGPQFCLGGVMESYPPQCSGPELIGWDWALYEGSETASDVTWGAYAVWGAWDGTALTVDSAVMLALYDPMPFVDPLLDPDNAGTTSAADLQAIQDRIHDDAPVEVLTSWPENGYLFVTVVFDDGAVQEWADATYGADAVAVRSALVPVPAG